MIHERHKSMNTTTPRQQHAERLALIKDLDGAYNRRFTFHESEAFLEAVEYYLSEGYPQEHATMYAYDHYFAERGAFTSNKLNKVED